MNTSTATETRTEIQIARAAKRAEKKAEKVAHIAKMAELHEKARAIVATGTCPECGAGLHRNLALTGWYLCDRSGSGDHRRDKTGAHCLFQTFTE